NLNQCHVYRSSSPFSYIIPPPVAYPLSLHDALPISSPSRYTPYRRATAPFGSKSASRGKWSFRSRANATWHHTPSTETPRSSTRSEEHTSELQSRGHLVCRLLLEKKKKKETEQKTPT